MRAAIESTGRRLGLACGPHNLEGSVYALAADRARPSDTPPWFRALRWLVLAPVVCTLIATALASRFLAGFLLPRRRPHSTPSALTYGLGGLVLGDVLARRRESLVQVWRLDTPTGARVVVRIGIPPSHASDVRVGDALMCWVRPQWDGTLAADRADNLRTGERISPRRPSRFVLAAVAVCAALLVVALLQASLAHI
jgi:hypothetical protein